jgi:hypothetical protein
MPVRDLFTISLPLPSARQIDAIDFELSSSPYPEFLDLNQPTMSLAWVKRLFSGERREKSSLKTHQYSRASSDLESLASTDAGTLLGEESTSDKKRSAIDARVVSDAIIGLSDGLTVPFALTAGLSALGDTRVVIFGGTAELIAGAISMGLGGYLGAKSEE